MHVAMHAHSMYVYVHMCIDIYSTFRLHVHRKYRNPRVFCCQVNMTSLWNLDLRFCTWLWNNNLHAFSCWFFVLTYHSCISVLKMTASETNFGMTKNTFFIVFRVWFGTLNFDIGRGNFMYCKCKRRSQSVAWRVCASAREDPRA